MGTTRDDIREWIERGVLLHHDFMIVVCDTFDHSDFPVYVSVEDFRHAFDSRQGGNMQRVMEVYNLNGDIEAQLEEERAWHFPEDYDVEPEDAEPDEERQPTLFD